MGKKFRILIINLILCFCMLFFMSGCLGGREVNDLEIVIGMGVDKGESAGEILLTAQVVNEAEAGRSSAKGGGEEGTEAYWNVTSTGKSIFEAVRQITHKTGNRLFVSHNQAVIFGNDIAKEGLHKYIDFFLRAHEMRPNALILVAEGRASDIMDAKPITEKFPALNISKLIKTYGFTSHFYKVNMRDFAACMMSATKAPIAPLVTVVEEQDEKDVFISGMAVFKEGKMIGKLNEDEVRGLLWVLGEVKSGVLTVISPDQQGNVILEILRAKSKVTPELKDGQIIMHIKIKQESSLSEQTTSENMATNEGFEVLQKAAEEAIRHEILAAFEKSKELNADIFGFGEMLYKKYIHEWKEIEPKWDDIYPTIQLDIEAEAKILKTDLLKKPVYPNEKEKEHGY